ncbi:uncharacterized protein LOC131302852 [Rhododendron vialii]|uniref:uncharacterized protein LOC131302852 n=1 Tax=Rhododendron vialii TaxID=182163 RepID=UPI00265FEA51|nr:uncharacterized protein LOC131302852 [Rhododendron vialii]
MLIGTNVPGAKKLENLSTKLLLASSSETALALAQGLLLPVDMQKESEATPDRLVATGLVSGIKFIQKMVSLGQKFEDADNERITLLNNNTRLLRTITRLERERDKAKADFVEAKNKLGAAEEGLNQALLEIDNTKKASYEDGYQKGYDATTASYVFLISLKKLLKMGKLAAWLFAKSMVNSTVEWPTVNLEKPPLRLTGNLAWRVVETDSEDVPKLGCLHSGYYRRFIRDYGKICQPLNVLLKKGAFGWTAEADHAFIQLKTAMTIALVLTLPNYAKPFMLECDASGKGVGAVLMQEGRSIAFYSKALSPTWLGLSTYEKELLAVVMSVTKWRHFLLGRQFIIKTDHQSLKFLLEQRVTTPMQQKWLSKLMGFDYEIVYKLGKTNVAADALSRMKEDVQFVPDFQGTLATMTVVLNLSIGKGASSQLGARP